MVKVPVQRDLQDVQRSQQALVIDSDSAVA
jgi:hypothetical protein